MKYKKLPVEVDVMLYTKETTFVQLVDFMGSEDLIYTFCDHELELDTLEGIMIAKHGDYIIKGVEGEFYPCKPDIFNKTYEKVDHG